MLKLIFILVINSYQGGVNTDLHFDNLAKCEAAKKQIHQEAFKGNTTFRATCLEMQVKPKKLNCKIINTSDYSNHYNSAYSRSMDGYPYPVGVECVEE